MGKPSEKYDTMTEENVLLSSNRPRWNHGVSVTVKAQWSSPAKNELVFE